MTTTPSTPPCSTAESTQFDFWIGRWDLSWPAEQSGGRAGDLATGTNRIEYLFGRCVVAEHFSTAEGDFRGRSWSVFDAERGVWRQTWVDNTGGYLLFVGGFDGATMELRSDPVERDGEQFVNRMVFGDIEPDSLRWNWQRSTPGSEVWVDLWTITYRRRS